MVAEAVSRGSVYMVADASGFEHALGKPVE